MNREEKISLYGYIEDLYQAMQIGNIVFEPKHSSELYDLISKVLKENQELKKQLSNSHQIKNQQKEFMDWLEDKIKFWKDKIFENAITENDWTLLLWRNKLGILEENLSKYKEIIGVDN